MEQSSPPNKTNSRQIPRLATRGSKLALWQANFIAKQLSQLGLETELSIIKTTGDIVQDRFLSEIGGKGLFVKELEESMLAGATDLAMHSLKDLPVNIREEFRLGAILKRHSFLDAIIFRNSLYSKLGLIKGEVLDAQKFKSLGKLRIATSSLRRKCLLENLHSNIEVVPIRGNVDTRLQKLEDLNLDAIILAEASLNRLSIENVHAHKLDYKWFIPCAGQGALAIELPVSSRFSQFIEKLNCELTSLHVSIERNILRALGGDCNMPFGCLVTTCERDPTKTLGQVLVMTPSGKECRVNHTVLTTDLNDGQQFASNLLDKLRDANVNSLLQELNVKIRL